MYSPKIREDLVRRLYQLAKRKGLTMTKLVNLYLEACVNYEERMLAEDTRVASELEEVLVRAILRGEYDGNRDSELSYQIRVIR
jgi:hypothetical protein